MMETSEKFGDKFQYVLAKAAGTDFRYIDSLLDDSDIIIAENSTYDIMRYADLLWVCSGTATLESALNGTPMIVLYKVGKLTEMIGKCVVKTKYIGLPNVIEGKEIIPELLQADVTADSLYEKTEEIFRNYSDYLGRVRNIKSKIDKKIPSENAAREIYSMLHPY
jgi:lipid-A-disaccharide synthase